MKGRFVVFFFYRLLSWVFFFIYAFDGYWLIYKINNKEAHIHMNIINVKKMSQYRCASVFSERIDWLISVFEAKLNWLSVKAGYYFQKLKSSSRRTCRGGGQYCGLLWRTNWQRERLADSCLIKFNCIDVPRIKTLALSSLVSDRHTE